MVDINASMLGSMLWFDCNMSYFIQITFWIWMFLDYVDFKGLFRVGSSIGFYSYIAQLWLRVVLDVGPNVLIWFMKCLSLLCMIMV